MLLIDKVKSAELMTYFWNKAAISGHFLPFADDDFLATIKITRRG
jgi:hypothetical protein